MSDTLISLEAPAIFNGTEMLSDRAVLMRGASIVGLIPLSEVPADAERHVLDGGVLSPGFVDLQVNGGGGLMFNDTPDVATLKEMSRAHARIGATTILPTLITDTAEQVRAAVSATQEAVRQGVPGIAGLHLEGPFLSQIRKGAHDPNLIRPMSDEDLAVLTEAARELPILKVTLAPENVPEAHIRVLAEAGALVSIGHSEATYETCVAAANAGARCVTHIFNAQSQMGNREPGVVGAALTLGELSAGLIADCVHVHPASMRVALRSKVGPGKIFLVSDAMATAGSDIDSFTLNGREIRRDGNRLTLADGTLAGAHLELADAVRNLVTTCDASLEDALGMATRLPAELIGRKDLGCFVEGAHADVIHLDDAGRLARVWQSGRSAQLL